MKVTKRSHYTLLEDDAVDTSAFAAQLLEVIEDFSNDNLVIDIHADQNISINDLYTFQDLSRSHYDNKKSFILIQNRLNIDNIPEALRVVPTLQEAEDTIQMEEIERDLGF